MGESNIVSTLFNTKLSSKDVLRLKSKIESVMSVLITLLDGIQKPKCHVV